MRSSKKDILEKLHKVEIEILDEFVRVCNKFDLEYFLVGGTLLGAVRHKGFIPWDDDIDIGMPRKDYEKFIKIAPDELKSNYFIQHFSNDSEYYLNFLKVMKKDTFFDQTLISKIETKKNIWIDIFPYDDVIKNEGVIYKIKNCLCKNTVPIIFYKKGIFTKQNLKYPFSRFLCWPFSYQFLIKTIEKIAKLNNQKKCEFMTSYYGSYDYRAETLSKNKIYPLKKIVFEGKKYNCFNDPDYYLERIYGDYMKLPPVEKRVAHLPQRIIFDTKKGESNE